MSVEDQQKAVQAKENRERAEKILQTNLWNDVKKDVMDLNDFEKEDYTKGTELTELQIEGISKQGMFGQGAVLMSNSIWFPKSQLAFDGDGQVWIKTWLYNEYWRAE